MFLKICGVTRREDALHAAAHGATAIGFVFWRGSPRYIAPERAAEIVAGMPPGVTTVGVFVNEQLDVLREVVTTTGIDMVQLHGDEPSALARDIDRPVLRSVTAEDAEDTCAAWPAGTTFLMDASRAVRGTGATADWNRAAAVARRWPLVLAGGLTAANVASAIEAVRPHGVDVSSGVEEAPGLKNPEQVVRFLENARGAFDTR